MKLNTLKAETFGKKIKWCGPTALAIISGRSLKFCHNKLARIAGKKPRYLKGAYNWQLLDALKEMKFKPIRIDAAYGLTLRKYIEEVQTTEHFRGVMLVNVTDHYVVISKGLVLDNRQGSVPLPVKDHPMWRKRIVKAWHVTKKKTITKRI